MGTTGQMAMGGEELTLQSLRGVLVAEVAALKAQGKKQSDATMIIRAHQDCPTGLVQEVVGVCQTQGFDTFALRVKEKRE